MTREGRSQLLFALQTARIRSIDAQRRQRKPRPVPLRPHLPLAPPRPSRPPQAPPLERPPLLWGGHRTTPLAPSGWAGADAAGSGAMTLSRLAGFLGRVPTRAWRAASKAPSAEAKVAGGFAKASAPRERPPAEEAACVPGV